MGVSGRRVKRRRRRRKVGRRRRREEQGTKSGGVEELAVARHDMRRERLAERLLVREFRR